MVAAATVIAFLAVGQALGWGVGVATFSTHRVDCEGTLVD